MPKYYGDVTVSLTFNISDEHAIEASNETGVGGFIQQAVVATVAKALAGQLYVPVENPNYYTPNDPSVEAPPQFTYVKYDPFEEVRLDLTDGDVEVSDLELVAQTWRVVVPVTYTIEGEYTVEVEAQDKSEARELAEQEVPTDYDDILNGYGEGEWDEHSQDYQTGYIDVCEAVEN